AHLAYVKQQNGGGQHSRHSDGGDQCDLEVAQKKQEDQYCENDAYEDRIPYALFRRQNQLALVVPVCNFNVRRQLLLKLCQFSFDFAGDLNGVAARLLMNLENHRVAAVGSHADPLGRSPLTNRGDISQPNQTARTGTNDRVTDLSDTPKPGIGHGEIQFVVIFHAADRLDDVGSGENLRHIAERQTIGIQARRVDVDFILTLGAA